jgi:hypothetical protein
MTLDSSTRAALIREGNEAFNAADYAKAKTLFLKAEYKDGLIRLGDYYMYERRLPLLAYGYYKKAGAKAKIEDIQRRMVAAIGEWLGRDKIKPESLVHTTKREIKTDGDGMVLVPVNPALKRAAQKILDGGKKGGGGG